MPKKSKAARLSWTIAGLGVGVACIIALIQGNGSLTRSNVLLLGFLGAFFFFGSTFGLKLHRAPSPIGTPVRTLLLLFLSAGLMAIVSWHVWPQSPITAAKQKEELPIATPTPAITSASPTPA